MNWEQTKEVWDFYFIGCPDTKAWLAKQADPNATFKLWRKTLKGCDFDDVFKVMNDMIDGDRDRPEAYERDRTAIWVRTQANDLRYERNRKIEQEEKYHTGARGAMKYVQQTETGGIACRLGRMVQEKKITVEENNRRFEEAKQWDKGQIEAPEWLRNMLARKLKFNTEKSDHMLGGKVDETNTQRSDQSESDQRQRWSGARLVQDSIDAESYRATT